MKIIKELMGAGSYFGTPLCWGLGDDNRLYYKIQQTNHDGYYIMPIPSPNAWWANDGYNSSMKTFDDWNEYGAGSKFGIPLEDMKKIVAAFGHLGVWI